MKPPKEWDRSERICPVCGTPFIPKRDTKRYCQQDCKWVASNNRRTKRPAIYECGTEGCTTMIDSAKVGTRRKYCDNCRLPTPRKRVAKKRPKSVGKARKTFVEKPRERSLRDCAKLNCGEKFMAYENDNRAYCSTDCKRTDPYRVFVGMEIYTPSGVRGRIRSVQGTTVSVNLMNGVKMRYEYRISLAITRRPGFQFVRNSLGTEFSMLK